ncbi:MAG: HAD hydrolase-like protein, partial [Acidobacteria bacterium]|nr:HAD hydrolase-like protein [Acidobacteriota bacterium]
MVKLIDSLFPMALPYKLIIFDLDGTLVDSARDLTESANQLIAERGGEPLEEHR